jgi:NAD(P)-dependent dehydrogenase (short-subunit alcohol dehydrogenase family)
VAVGRAVQEFGHLDVVVSAAGYGIVGAVEELSNGELLEQINVNVLGVHRVVRARCRRCGPAAADTSSTSARWPVR